MSSTMITLRTWIECYGQLIACYMSLANPIAGGPDINSRIVGGTLTTIDQVQYLVQLHRDGAFFCGGSIVSTRHIVTAAHCVYGVPASSLTVVGGATTVSEAGTRRAVSRMFLPKGYSVSSMHMDVAVLKLKSPMVGPHIKVIPLCGNGPTWKAGDFVQVSGWGQTAEKDKAISQTVRTVHVALIAKAKCKQQFKGRAVITASMFCASVPGARDSCAGDSGGPVVFSGELCGVVSWGIGCGRPNFPGVYTNVNVVKAFIQEAMQK